MQKTVTIYGAGYVGLVTGACLAELGHQVLIIDTQLDKIADLTRGICPIYEPGLEDLLKRHLATGRLTFGSDLIQGVEHGLFQFIAVGTPSSDDGSADLTYVFAVVKGIAANLSVYRVIVTKSTVPIGTAKRVKQCIEEVLQQRGFVADFDVVSNPEFLKQGGAIADFMRPDRLIIGADNERALKYLRELYADLDDNGQRFIAMDVSSAELAKYAANAYLATRISFMNEMSQLAEHLGADIDMIRRGMGSDRRIGPHFLMAGCGFGGSCFPKDVRALIKMAESVNCITPLIQATDSVNHRQKQVLFEKICLYFAGDITGKTIAVWGLAFKPNTDDMREAPSQVLINALLNAGAKVQAYDPAARAQAERIFAAHPDLLFYDNSLAVLDGADVLVVVTEWDEFKHPDFELIGKKLRYPAIFDGRNMYDAALLAAYNLKYYAIGHGNAV